MHPAAAITALVLASAGLGALDSLVADRCVLLDRDGRGDRGAWPAAYGGAGVERADGVLRIAISGTGQLGLVNFNGHQPLDVPAIPREPAPVVRLDVRLHADGERRLRLGWRAGGEPAFSADAVHTLRPGSWTSVILPMPGSDAPAAGWAVGLDGPGRLELREAVLGWRTRATLDPLPRLALADADAVALSGRASETSEIVLRVAGEDGGIVLERRLPVRDGAWSGELRRADLPAFAVCSLSAALPGSTAPDARSSERRLYAFPAAGRPLPALVRRGGQLLSAGRPFAFTGINHTDLMMPHARESDREALAREVGRMQGWGMRVMRVALVWGMIQPAPGVFPGDPRWLEEIRSRGLNQRWVEDLDFLVRLAGERGIYSVIDLHEPPCDPYRWFTGGDHNRRDAPGTAIAWLAPDARTAGPFELENPVHRRALVDTWAWLARHFAGDGNIMCFEAPFNEPHDAFMSAQENWAAVTQECALAIKAADPGRLVFSMPAGWGHDNVGWSFTWMQPAGIDGIAPHHYIGNGPVPMREDAKAFEAPWYARDAEATFARALPALFLATGTARMPVYNGEGGDWMPRILLPGIEESQARLMMYEATIVQSWAAGLAGHLNWRVTHDDKGYDLRVYASARRFAEVFDAGPLDWSHAEVAIVQNTDADPSVNSHNFSAVPFAEMMLALHLGPVHYLSDDQVLYRGIARQSKGLEQVGDSVASFAGYKAILVDPRNLDGRVAAALRGCRVPQLVVADPARMDLAAIAEFLRAQGVGVDTSTPADIQVAIGPQHVVLFRRGGAGGSFRLHTAPAIDGVFRLEDEAGRVVFSGTAAELRARGAGLSLDRWRAAFLRIRR